MKPLIAEYQRKNPRSHPHGGGEGRSGIGMNTPKTYAGRKAVGKTRRQWRSI
jgi:large subunit ribosomal protein L2